MTEKPGITRREEITKIMDNTSSEEISEVQKEALGKWLEQRYDVLHNKVDDGTQGITKSDVIEAYSAASWGQGSGSRMLWNDMKMLKDVAAHFDRLALAGESSSAIDKDDVTALKGNARVRRTEHDVTSDFPDGSLQRRTEKGELYQRKPDGSISFDTGLFGLELDNSTGKGHFEVKTETASPVPGIDTMLPKMRIELERAKDGTWWGKDDGGNEMQLAIDDHSVRVRMSDMDMLVTTKGGFMRDPTDPNFAVYMNPDGTTTLVENGNTHEIAYDKGFRRVLDSDGTNWYTYPFETTIRVDPDKTMHIGVIPMLPEMKVTPQGEISGMDEDGKQFKASAGPDGKTSVGLPDLNAQGMVVSRNLLRDTNGVLTANFKRHSDNVEAQIEVHPDGMVVFNFGHRVEFRPPEIRRPK
jgi:hypothetical protein